MNPTLNKKTLKKLAAFFSRNPGINESVDKVSGDEIQELTRKDIELRELLNIHFRLYRVYPYREIIFILLEKGHTSAHSISRIARKKFTDSVKKEIDEKLAGEIHKKAKSIAQTVTQMVMSIKSVMSVSYTGLHVNNMPPSLQEYLKTLPGYKDFFGDQDYCDCDEFASIFGPPAYLTDLLRIIDRAITSANPNIASFNSRRPDIQNILLTAADAVDEVPYLEIVNNVLAEHIPSDGEDPYQKLATQLYPFNLPYNPLLDQIKLSLSSLNFQLADVYKLFNPDSSLTLDQACDILNISPEQYQNLLKPVDDATYDMVNYGIIHPRTLKPLSELDSFSAVTGLSVDKVNDLLIGDLSFQEIFDVSGTWNITFDKTGESFQLNLEQNGDQIYGSYTIPDLNQELRVVISYSQNPNGWSPLAEGRYWPKGSDQSSSGAIQFIFDNDGKSLTARWNYKPGENWDPKIWTGTRDTSSAGIIPSGFIINKEAGLSESQYIKITILNKDGVAVKELSPATVSVYQSLNRMIRLQSYLGWSYTKLDWLIRSLQPALTRKKSRKDGILDEQMFLRIAKSKVVMQQLNLDPDATIMIWADIRTHGVGNQAQSTAPFDMIFNNPSLLLQNGGIKYHPLMSPEDGWVNPLYQDQPLPYIINSLQSPVKSDPSDADIQRGLILVSAIPASKTDINKIANALFGNETTIHLTVRKLSALYRHSVLPAKLGLSIDEYLILMNLCGFTDESGILISDKIQPEEMLMIMEQIKWIKVAGLSMFEMNFLCNGIITPQVNPAYNKATADSLLIQISTALSIISEPDLRTTTFNSVIAAFFNTTPDIIEYILLTVAHYLNKTEDQIIELFLQQSDLNDVYNIINDTARFLYLKNKFSLNKTDFSTLINHNIIFQPEVVTASINPFLPVLEALYQFNDLKTQYNDQQDNLNLYFDQAFNELLTEEDLIITLNNLTNWPATEIYKVSRLFWPNLKSCNTVNKFLKLQAFFSLINLSGEDSDFLIALNSLRTAEALNDWALYQQSVEKVQQALRSQVPDSSWDTLNDHINGKINENKRDVLVPVVLNSLSKKNITDERSLYEFLLIDVSIAGCSTISVIKEALNAAQLYLQRCRLNLEENVTLDTNELPEIYWEWIMNYRVWEANREVFLYPENYLDATLRSNKSDLFSSLQADLQQSDLSEGSVEDSFRKYLEGLEIMTSLKYVDAYRTNVKGPDGNPVPTLFLLARTPDSPYTYYYITRTGIEETWSNWEIINLTIKTDTATLTYAFEKLFIFWIELDTTIQQPPQAGPNLTITKLSVKYSILNYTGNWSTPRTLVNNNAAIMQIPGQAQIYYPFPIADFDPTLPIWKKVMAIPVSPEQFNPDSAPRDEKLMILYGPMYQPASLSPLPWNITPVNPALKDDFTVFVNNINDAIGRFGSISVNDYTTFYPPVVLDRNLESSYLIKSQEIVTFSDNKSLLPISAFTCNYMVSGNPVIIYPVNNTIQNNYVDGSSLATLVPLEQPLLYTYSSFNSITAPYGVLGQIMTDLDMLGAPYFKKGPDLNSYIIAPESRFLTKYGYDKIFPDLVKFDQQYGVIDQIIIIVNSILEKTTPILFNNVYADSFQIFEVKNQPGWLVLQYEGQCFLLEAKANEVQPANFPLLTKGVYVNGQSAKLTQLYYIGQPGFEAESLYDFKFRTTRLNTDALTDLSSKLTSQGIDGLMSISSQQAPVNLSLPFSDLGPGLQVDPPLYSSSRQVDFSGPFGNYYWELFFHAPMLIAQLCNSQGKYSDAQRWLNYIVNPTVPPVTVTEIPSNDISVMQSDAIIKQLKTAPLNLLDETGTVQIEFQTYTPITLTNALQLSSSYQGEEVFNVLLNNYLELPSSRYWQFQPFRNYRIETLEGELLNSKEISVYNNDPFDPHAIARIRWGAYEKKAVMQYIDNLLAWGDSEFTQYSWESITSATMLYNYAYDMLGPQPIDMGACKTQLPVNFSDISEIYGGSQKIPEFLINLEDFASEKALIHSRSTPYNDLQSYFCIPDNQQLLSYWSRVQDRLYKIRNCMNILGQKESLALYQPPINPMNLVRAAFNGNGAFNPQQAPTGIAYQYRFDVLISQAKELTSNLVSFGQKLQDVLEKKDAQHMQVLKASHASQLLSMTTAIRLARIAELESMINLWESNIETANDKINYYSDLVTKGLSSKESSALALRMDANYLSQATLSIYGASVAGYLMASIFGLANGGMKYGEAIQAGATILDKTASLLSDTAAILITSNDYDRRNKEWQFQLQMAYDELSSNQIQLNGANIQLSSAQQELAVHLKDIELSAKEENYLSSQFTNEDLYQWMVSRVSAIYYQAYQLALTMSMNAQAAYQIELNSTSTFITCDYWFSLNKGLLAGEGLQFSLSQMHTAYLTNNKRLMEIEKTVSLRQLFPVEFLKFISGTQSDGGILGKGEFNFNLSQQLFDLDFPSFYQRKIKSVSITLPAVVGPYQNLNAKLTQNSNAVLLKTDSEGLTYIYDFPADSKKTISNDIVRVNWQQSQEIAISKGIDDNGLFQLNFDDPRYLPFEGTGVVSSWTFSLPPDNNRIDFNTISDIIIKIRYTATEGGNSFLETVQKFYKNDSKKNPQYCNSLIASQSFASQWNQLFRVPPDKDGYQYLTFPMNTRILLPNMGTPLLLKINIVSLLNPDTQFLDGNDFAWLIIGNNAPLQIDFNSNVGNIIIPSLTGDPLNSEWQIKINPAKADAIATSGRLDSDKLKNLIVIIEYSVPMFSTLKKKIK